MAFGKAAISASLHFAKISLHFPKLQGGDRFDGGCIHRQIGLFLAHSYPAFVAIEAIALIGD